MLLSSTIIILFNALTNVKLTRIAKRRAMVAIGLIITVAVVTYYLEAKTKTEVAHLPGVWIAIAQQIMTVVTRQCAAALTYASTKVVLGVQEIATVTQVRFVAKKLFLLTKPSVLRAVLSKLAISTTIVPGPKSVVDQECVQAQAVMLSVLRTPSAIWVNIVAKKVILLG